jgi:UDP-N-acetylmuramyl pentapeptide phosphotransferase/UDP-N-acetylglucosamine-1-phosphate transferase
VQFRFALACAKQLDTQVETPLKLGYCAVLVVLALVAEAEELVVLVAVPVAAVVVVVLRLVSCEVEEETVDDAPCDHTMEMKRCTATNKGHLGGPLTIPPTSTFLHRTLQIYLYLIEGSCG